MQTVQSRQNLDVAAEQTARASAPQQEASPGTVPASLLWRSGGSAGSGMSQSPRVHTAGGTSTSQEQVETHFSKSQKRIVSKKQPYVSTINRAQGSLKK